MTKPMADGAAAGARGLTTMIDEFQTMFDGLLLIKPGPLSQCEEWIAIRKTAADVDQQLCAHTEEVARLTAEMGLLHQSIAETEVLLRDAHVQIDAKESTIMAVVHTVGGTVEGRPTERVNFLQRVRELLKAEAEVERLTQRLHAVEADRCWQDISTAPKDATRVLLAGHGHHQPVVVGYFDAYYAEGGRGFVGGSGWTCEDDESSSLWPTHWMPLPSPPLADRAASLAAPAQEKK